MSFRRTYRKDLPMRVLDVLLHVIAACITGSLWQWGPDIMLVIIWPYSMIVDERLPDSSFLLEIHKALHSILTVCLLWVVAVWWHPVKIVALNWAIHWFIDAFTHRDWKA